MKTTLLIFACLFSVSAYSQRKEDGYTTLQNGIKIADTDYFIHQRWRTVDTIPVIAYCIDAKTLKTQWRKLYAIEGWNNPSINMNGLMLYQSYLMPDRKTPVTYKVVYAINSK